MTKTLAKRKERNVFSPRVHHQGLGLPSLVVVHHTSSVQWTHRENILFFLEFPVNGKFKIQYQSIALVVIAITNCVSSLLLHRSCNYSCPCIHYDTTPLPFNPIVLYF